MKNKILNTEILSTTELRAAAVQICEVGLQAIDTEVVVRGALRREGEDIYVRNERVQTSEGGRIFVIAIGKCAHDASKSIEDILGDKLYKGISLDVRDGELSKMKAFKGIHPMPSHENVIATSEIISMLGEVQPNDLVIYIISGGGSTLLCDPTGMTFGDEVGILKILFEVGADIKEINILRKHLSLARGGNLAKYASGAKRFALIFSDVPGNDISFIASGPTVLDTTTIQDAKAIAEKYGIWEKTGLSESCLRETPKDEKDFVGMENILVVSNEIALDAMAKKAEELGFKSEIRDTKLQGEAKVIGERFAEEAHTASPGTAIFYGGETTVKLAKEARGEGGRNQEVVLSAAKGIRDGELVVSLASDGQDHSEFAGALCDTMTIAKGKEKNLNPDDFLKTDNTFSYFREVGDYIMTGYTGSNVSDIMFVLKK